MLTCVLGEDTPVRGASDEEVVQYLKYGLHIDSNTMMPECPEAMHVNGLAAMAKFRHQQCGRRLDKFAKGEAAGEDQVFYSLTGSKLTYVPTGKEVSLPEFPINGSPCTWALDDALMIDTCVVCNENKAYNIDAQNLFDDIPHTSEAWEFCFDDCVDMLAALASSSAAASSDTTTVAVAKPKLPKRRVSFLVSPSEGRVSRAALLECLLVRDVRGAIGHCGVCDGFTVRGVASKLVGIS